MRMFNNFIDDNVSTNVIGSFNNDKTSDFKNRISYVFEQVKSQQLDPLRDITKVLGIEMFKENYKQDLIGDILEECEQFENGYNALGAKLEQLFENSAVEILNETYMQQNPIVGLTLPILKKSFIEGHAKDIVMTEVPDKPIIRTAFERKFLKDINGAKYYLPDVFYDDSYKAIMSQSKGNPISSSFYPTGVGKLPFNDLNILEESGGSLRKRDTLSLDFCVKNVIMQCDSETVTVPVNIYPQPGNSGVFNHEVTYTDPSTGKVYKDKLFGQVDFYSGVVSAACAQSLIQKIQFGGHLSNETNTNTVELDSERTIMTWQIEEGERLNTGLTVEKIKDHRVLLNTDVTASLISDMSTVLAQTEDSNILSFLNESYESWNKRSKDLVPFGYNDGFVETGYFDCDVPVNKYVTQSEYLESELKFNINRFIDRLKIKLRTPDIMFVLYGHPNHVTLLNSAVRWMVNEDTKIGGVQLEYSYGIMTENKNRIMVLSTMKCPLERGLRIVAYPTNQDTITFKHFKYSLNIENSYRNPLTPNIPNIMATSRYKTIEVTPVQGEFRLKNTDFAVRESSGPTVSQVVAPKLSLEDGSYNSEQTVTVTCDTPSAIIYYTVDGSDPKVGISPIYSGAITIAATATLKVVAAKVGMVASNVVTGNYTITI